MKARSMQDHIPSEAAAALGGLAAKLLPAGIGATLVVLVDPPADKKELFARFFIGLAMSGMFTELTIDLLRNLSWFSALTVGNVWHVVAVAGVWGGIGWFVVGGLVMWLKKLRADPVATIAEAKKDLT